jgi:hypothetical protein
MSKLIQLQTEQVLLTYLLASSVDENLSFARKKFRAKNIGGFKRLVGDAKENNNR